MFSNFYSTSSGKVNLKTGDFTPYQTNCPDLVSVSWHRSLLWRWQIVKIKELMVTNFLLTYGDGLSNIDIDIKIS